MRKNLKANAVIISKINPGMNTALFENTTTQFDDEGDQNNTAENYYTAITEYKGINQENYKSPGNVSLSAFREKLIGLRTSLKDYKVPPNTAEEGDSYGFEVKLRIQDDGDDQKVYYMAIGVYRKVIDTTTGELGADEYGRIRMLTGLKHPELEAVLPQNTNGEDDDNVSKIKYYYGMKDLIVDSDVDDRIWRFVGENEWRSTTYMILDLNKNLSINKGAYLTLNMPFTNNIGWYEPMRKRVDGWKVNDIAQMK